MDPSGYQPVSFGRPPAQCAELQDFETAPGLRAVIDDSALPRSAWEHDMERRVISSERMLGEIRTLVSNLCPTAPTATLDSAAQSVSADMPTGEGRSMVRGCLYLDNVLLSGDLITISSCRCKHSAIQGPQSLQIQGACSPGSSIYVAAFLRDFLRARGVDSLGGNLVKSC